MFSKKEKYVYGMDLPPDILLQTNISTCGQWIEMTTLSVMLSE
jgi:hypothetical protein